MIRTQTFTSAIACASSLADKGLTLVTNPSTPLSELYQLSTPTLEYQIEAEDYMSVIGSVVESVTGEESQHSAALGQIKDSLSNAVRAHVSFSKNVVKPLVVQLAALIQQYMESNRVPDAAARFNIIQLSVPGVLRDESFLGSLNYYTGKAALTPDVKVNLDNKTTEALMQLVLVGHERTDKLILDWISAQEPDFLTLIWSSFFTVNDAQGLLSVDRLAQMNVYDRLNALLAIYLLARKLYDEVDESAADIALSVYKEAMVQLRDYAGSSIAESIRKIALFERTKQLIIESDSAHYTVKVNGDLYKDWLSSGGKPETILGVVVSGDPIYSQVAIDQKAEDYLAKYNAYVMFFKVDQSNKAFDYYKDFLRTSFSTLLKTLDPAEEEYIKTCPQYYETVNKLLEQSIQALKSTDMPNVYDVALILIGKCRFFYTGSYEILNDIREAGLVNPNIDVREAALLATINYLADYLTDQINVVR